MANAQEIIERLSASQSLALPLGYGVHIKAGERLAFVLFHTDSDGPRPYLKEEPRQLLEQRLEEMDAEVELVELEPSLLEELIEAEALGQQLAEELRSGEVSYELFGPGWLQLYFDGVGYGVCFEDYGQGPEIVEMVETQGDAVFDAIARDVQRGDERKKMKPISESLRAAVAARLLEQGDVERLLGLVEQGKISISGGGPTTDMMWTIALIGGSIKRGSDRGEQKVSSQELREILERRAYTSVRHLNG